ncbi:MAG: hypothetical protein OJF49_000558 [Ktedonobacterales bacterium]|jgi:DNA-binding MarR family transcriptional regulator|nr:MAG: hypothetical protein OJF49_000558 [Ktedonobacterales bacterium]
MDEPADLQSNPTARKLWQAFTQLKRGAWHEQSIAGCTLSEVRLLFLIRRGRRAGRHIMKVSDLSKLLHVTSPAVTQLLNSLESRMLVERHMDPTDRRAISVTLTDSGLAVVQQAADAFDASFQGLVEYLGEEQSDQLAELLTKVLRYYNEKAPPMHSTHLSGDHGDHNA